MRPQIAAALMLRWDIVAADHVEDDVDATSVRLRLHDLDEILFAVVDRPGRAEALAGCAFLRAARGREDLVGRARATSGSPAVPMPLDPPWTSTLSPALRRAASIRLVQTVKCTSGQRRSIDQRHAFGHRQHAQRGGERVLRIAAAGDQRADLVADLAIAHALAQGFDDARNLPSPGPARRRAAADTCLWPG